MADKIEKVVESKYAAVARSGLSSEQAGVRAVAEAFGYSSEELASIPAEANMGLSCGNPTAYASLRPGEVVVDLGSGGGLDVFLAAKKVGPTGKAIGIDMTADMIDLARRNAAKADGGKPLANVEFHLATIDHLPLPDASVDVVISNCVINLAPDKPAVFREIARVLKPGGRLAASDIALKKPLPAEIAADVAAYTGCIAGAIPIERYRQGLIDAGLAHVQVVDSGADLNAYAKAGSGCCSAGASEEASASPCCSASPTSAGSSCCGSEPVEQAMPEEPSGCGCGCGCGGSVVADDQADLHDQLAELMQRYDVNDYAASVKVYAVKTK
jgi:SAM-dependent methyltransferase